MVDLPAIVVQLLPHAAVGALLITLVLLAVHCLLVCSAVLITLMTFAVQFIILCY